MWSHLYVDFVCNLMAFTALITFSHFSPMRRVSCLQLMLASSLQFCLLMRQVLFLSFFACGYTQQSLISLCQYNNIQRTFGVSLFACREGSCYISGFDLRTYRSQERRILMSTFCLSVTFAHSGVPQNTQSEDTGPAPISPVFRTGSEPLLSPRPRHTRPSHPGNTLS